MGCEVMSGGVDEQLRRFRAELFFLRARVHILESALALESKVRRQAVESPEIARPVLDEAHQKQMQKMLFELGDRVPEMASEIEGDLRRFGLFDPSE